jgi:hypothetical protein
LTELLMGKLISQAISAAAELGVADALDDQPRSADELAAKIGAHGPSLYRLLRTLSVVGIFSEAGDGTFSHSPLSRTLQSTNPASALPIALMVASEWHWRPWAQLADSIRTGRSAFESIYGMGMFEYLRRDPAAGSYRRPPTGR